MARTEYGSREAGPGPETRSTRKLGDACVLTPGPSVSSTDGFSQLMPVAIPFSISLDTGPLETDLILIDPIVPLSNRYSPLSKDLDIYIKEGTRPRNNGPSIVPITLSSEENNAPSVDETFLFKTPKDVLQPKEKRKLDKVEEEEDSPRLNKKERTETEEMIAP